MQFVLLKTPLRFWNGSVVADTDQVPVNTIINVSVDGINCYKGTVSGQYRVIEKDIAKVSTAVLAKEYTGSEIRLTKDDIVFKSGKNVLDDVTFEIDETSYKNNIKKGTASVVIKGTGEYGGTKTVKYSIRTKGFIWWWNKLK